MMRRALLAAPLLLLFAHAAGAASVDHLEWTLKKKGRRVVVTVEATLSAPGEILLTGDVNGVAVEKRKRVRRAGTRRTRFRVDARRLGFRRLDAPLVFDLAVTAQEVGGDGSERALRVERPVPVVLLPGLGNEQGTSSVEALAATLVLAGYEEEGKPPSLLVHGYDSLTTSLSDLGRELDRPVRKLLKGTPFSRVDVVGFSMGGLVARSWMARGGGAGKVRKCVLVGTPNEGTPLAYLAGMLTDLSVLGDVVELGGIADLLLGADTKEALRNFHPTYDWLLVTLPVVGTVPVPASLLPESDSPLTALNGTAPDATADYHALAYRELGAGAFPLGAGTLDTVNLSDVLGDEVDLGALLAGDADLLSLLASGDLDLLSLASGEGDGLVPLRSALMEDVPAWRERITAHDMGTGTHLTFFADPAVIVRIEEILAGE